MSLKIRKRDKSDSEFSEKLVKRPRLNNILTSDSEVELVNETKECEQYSANELKQFIPHFLIDLMYQQDLAIHCLLEMLKREHEYQLKSLAFKDFEIDKFSDLVIHCGGRSIHVRIQNLDERFGNDLDYTTLFVKSNHGINELFNSFVRYKISKLDQILNHDILLIMFTNGRLNLSDGNKLMHTGNTKFYPFKFKAVDTGQYEVLKAILLTNGTVENAIYQFSQDNDSREELSKLLQISPRVKKLMEMKETPLEFEDMLKEEFFNRFVYIVNQASREELNMNVRKKVQTLGVQYDYFQDKLLNGLKIQTRKSCLNCLCETFYEFNVFMTLLHGMFLNEGRIAINCEENRHDWSNYITVCVKGAYSYLVVRDSDSILNYKNLFPSKTKCSQVKAHLRINKYFINFAEELEKNKNIKHFIIYTNASLDLSERNTLRSNQLEDSYGLVMKRVNIQKKKYSVLKTLTLLNEKGLFKFAKGKTRKNILSLLSLPKSKQRLDVGENMKDKFLDALVLAVDQFDKEELYKLIRNQLLNCTDFNFYRYEELHEVAIRWLESHKFGPITKTLMEKFLEDVKQNLSSQQECQSLDWEKRIQFAKKIARVDDASLVNFAIALEGRLEIMRKNGIKMSNLSSILYGAGKRSTQAFINLYDLLFDKQGNATRYLKLPQNAGISISSITNILSRSGTWGAKYYKNFCDVLFDEDGNKTHNLQNLEKHNMTLANMSTILQGSRSNAAKAFNELCELWFDERGTKSQYLRNLEREGINLATMASILNSAGANAANTFRELYFICFDENGNTTQCLKNLKRCGSNLRAVSCILTSAGSHAVEAFQGLYDLWFDDDGNETPYLKNLKDGGVNIKDMSTMLNGAGCNAPTAFKELHDLWFDESGNKTQYLKSMEAFGLDVHSLSGILNGGGTSAARAFIDLYDVMFNKNGSKTQYLKALEREGITISELTIFLKNSRRFASKVFLEMHDLLVNDREKKRMFLKTLEKNEIKLRHLTRIISGAGTNSAEAFQELYSFLFDDGQKSKYLKNFQNEGISLSQVSVMIDQAGTDCGKAFKELHDLWFDMDGNKTQYLKNLQVLDIGISQLAYVLMGSGVNAADTHKELYCFFFDENGYKSKQLKDLESIGMSAKDILRILYGAGSDSGKALRELYSTWFDKNGHKTPCLENLLKYNIHRFVCPILERSGSRAKIAFQKLYDLWIDGEGNKTKYLSDLEKIGINLAWLHNLLIKSGQNAAQAFEEMYAILLDKKGSKTPRVLILEKSGLNINHIFSIFKRTGLKFSKAFNELYDLWFDKEGEKTFYLKQLENEGINLRDIAAILTCCNANAAHIFKELYDLWFDGTGNKTQIVKCLESVGIGLRKVSLILKGKGSKAKISFNNLYKHCFCGTEVDESYVRKLKSSCAETKSFLNSTSGTRVSLAQMGKSYVKNGVADDYNTFMEKYIVGKECELCILSNELKGVSPTETFAEQLSQFQFEASRVMEMLTVFFNAGFKASNIFCILTERELHHFETLEQSYLMFFDEKGKKRKILLDFLAGGMQPGDLCQMLSGAAEKLVELHGFCFIENKNYLSDFVSNGFYPKLLSTILHGCGADVCSSLKDFHEACFVENGVRTQLFEDFLTKGFKPKCLSQLFAVTGNDASSVIKKFHKLFFIQKPYYLNNCLTQETIFSPKIISKILYGCGIYVSTCLRKLHNICFDRAGNKTNFLNNLLENNCLENVHIALQNSVKDVFADEK